MANVIQQFLSGKISVSENAWHYHVYQWWKRHGGEISPSYRENLCHYMRVILIWTPLLWFFKAPFYRKVRPWMIILGLVWAAWFWNDDAKGRIFLGGYTIFWGFWLFTIFDSKSTKQFFRKISPPFIWIWRHGLKNFLIWFFDKGVVWFFTKQDFRLK